MNDSGRRLLYALAVLVLVAANVAVFGFIFIPRQPHLTVSFLDVGQGDSIFITGPTGIQMLIDGGPDRSVLRRLSSEMLPFDRSIDVVVETHPDKDHIAGLADVLERYQVREFASPGIPDKTDVSAHVMELARSEPGATQVTLRRGMRIHLGGGAYADVLFPDRDESAQTVTNDGSVVLHVVYGSTSFLLTGDLPSTFEDYLVALDGTDGELASDVLKAGHHGSKYSTDSLWLSAVHPSYVVISAGKGNSYGHPNQETLERVHTEGARILSTMDAGTIRFVSDGQSLVVK